MLQSGIELDSLAHVYTYTEELHKSGLIRTAGHPETQKIQNIGFFPENRLHWQTEVRLLPFAVPTCV